MQENKTISVILNTDLKDYREFVWALSGKGNMIWTLLLICYVIYNQYWFGGIFLVLYFTYVEIARRKSSKKYFETYKIKHKETIYTFSEDNIEIVKTDGSHTSYIKWEEVYKVKQTKKIFILMTSTVTGEIIPKRFMSQEQIALLEELVKKKLDFKNIK